MVNETINATLNRTRDVIRTTAPRVVENTRIISWIPDWLFFVILLIISIAIYYALPDDARTGVRNFLKTYGFFVFLFLAWLYFRNKWGIVAENEAIGQMKLATFIVISIIVIYLAFVYWLYENRYKTHQAIANNRHGSCHRIQEIGDWCVLFIGGSGMSDSGFVIPWPWVKEMWVVPKKAVMILGNQIVVLSQIDKYDYTAIDEEVSHFVESDPFAKNVKDIVYYGLWDENMKATNPSFSEIQELNKKLNQRIVELKKMLEGKLTTTKGFISDTLAMTDKVKGKDWTNRNRRDFDDD